MSEIPNWLMNAPSAGDDAAVERFEAFVHSQQPAQPWTPVTPYDFESRRIAEGQQPALIKEVFQPQTVLDAGCGFGYLVRLLREQGIDAYGFDLYDGHQQKPAHCVSGDLLEEDLVCERGGFVKADLVICREVLEHLTVRQVAQAVRNLVKLSRRYVYGTTRFNPAPVHLLDVKDHDDLDPTHITLLNRSFLDVLFVLEGCTRRRDLEQAMDWKGYGRTFVYEVPR